MSTLSAADPVLTLRDITRRYGRGDSEIFALRQVSLTIHRGEYVAIMGPSGSGKSTLMNIIGCLDRASSGSYQIFGTAVESCSSDELAALRRDTFGFIFQRYNLLTSITAQENVELPAAYAGTQLHARSARATELLQLLHLGSRCSHYPMQLSGGQQQRVAIARALVNNPPILLADEPTGALDSQSGGEILALLDRLHIEGRTILLITHDQQVAEHAARIIKIHDGEIVEDRETIRKKELTVPPVISEKQNSHILAPIKESLEFTSSAREAISMAFRTMRGNLFRTALTLLGIVIGVSSVITMLAVGDGSKEKVLKQIQSMGTDLLAVRPGAPGIRGGGDIVTLTSEDAETIGGLENSSAVVPERSGRFTVRFRNIDYQTTVTAVGATFSRARDWKVVEGQFFSEADVKSYAPVAVIGKTVVEKLFPHAVHPIGQYILVRNVPFLVIGIMAERGASPGGSDMDDALFVPLTTGFIRLFGKSYLSSITVKMQDSSIAEQTVDEITRLLSKRHPVEDFNVRNMSAIVDVATQTQDALTLLLGVVAGISLLVGGIGVMNIMLVNVTERTREIGVRMATGARVRDILLQFNIEAVVVCACGGLIGVVLGFLATFLLRSAGVSVVFSLLPATIAFSSAFITGVLFGYLPAKKAAKLDPVIALATD